jgi:hypothetical protein
VALLTYVKLSHQKVGFAARFNFDDLDKKKNQKFLKSTSDKDHHIN